MATVIQIHTDTFDGKQAITLPYKASSMLRACLANRYKLSTAHWI